MPCEYCCKKDEQDNFISDEPCCGYSGKCCAEDTDSDISMCECCGAEMHKEGGVWWHYSQMDMPIEERGTIHHGK